MSVPPPNKPKIDSSSIGEVLAKAKSEKIMVTLPVCLQPTLAEYVKKQGGSTFIRENLMENLQRRYEEWLEKEVLKDFE